ncbi:hypothetical protein CHU98_g4537 [Xylaria longipes]|nr:hypothetical protein CHU98_g4537 [Xylaria longipes]
MTHVDTRHIGASWDTPLLDNPSRAMFSKAVLAANGAYRDEDTAKSESQRDLPFGRNDKGISASSEAHDALSVW